MPGPYRGAPRHPVHELLAEAAYAGRQVSKEELDELELEPAARKLVQEAARKAAFLSDGGERGRARELALQRAHEIIGELPEAQQHPLYLEEPDRDEELGPVELAARVPR